MILNEMVHDARIVRIGGQHLPATVRKWMGDSSATGKATCWSSTRPTSPTRRNFRVRRNLHVVERFTRLDDGNLLYRFTVEDPTTWDRAVDRRISLASDARTALRIRVPRRQLCAVERAERRPPERQTRSGESSLKRGVHDEMSRPRTLVFVLPPATSGSRSKRPEAPAPARGHRRSAAAQCATGERRHLVGASREIAHRHAGLRRSSRSAGIVTLVAREESR